MSARFHVINFMPRALSCLRRSIGASGESISLETTLLPTTEGFREFNVANKVEEEYAPTSVSAHEQGNIVSD